MCLVRNGMKPASIVFGQTCRIEFTELIWISKSFTVAEQTSGTDGLKGDCRERKTNVGGFISLKDLSNVTFSQQQSLNPRPPVISTPANFPQPFLLPLPNGESADSSILGRSTGFLSMFKNLTGLWLRTDEHGCSHSLQQNHVCTQD